MNTWRIWGLAGLLALMPYAASAADVYVNMTNMEFTPKHITVNPGDRVTWTNTSGTSHTVTSDTGLFGSPTLTPHSTYWRTFSTPGIYAYYCSLHGGPGGAGMSGTIVVNPLSTSTVPTPAPAPQTVVPVQTVTPVQTPVYTPGSSAPVDALKQQLAALLARVAALQSQLTGAPVPTTGTPTTSTPAAGGLQCPHISRTLQIGSEGADVTRLQQFLATDPAVYPEAKITGYYGALTEAAVKRFQCKNKIVCEGTPETTGYGVTGPRTAALLALQCPDVIPSSGGTSNTPSGFMRVTPTTGAAPLAVAVDLTLNTARSCAGSSYEVHYGDAAAAVSVNVPANHCNEFKQTLSHTYSAPGTYTVTLRSGVHQNTATIVVSAPAQQVSDTIVANPSSGAAPLAVTFTGIANGAAQCDAGPYTIQFGDGTNASVPLSGCNPVNYSINHTYTAGGTHIVRLYKGQPAVEASAISVTVTGQAQPTSGGNFSVTAGAGGNPKTVQVAFNLAASCSRFELNWGDGSQLLTQGEGTCAGGAATKTYTHTYVNGGNFTLSLKRGADLQFIDSASVVIAE